MLSNLKKQIGLVRTEVAEKNVVARELRELGYRKSPQVTKGKTQDRRVVRMYLWRETPLGNLCLVTGPSVEGKLYELHPHTGDSRGDLYFPRKGSLPALSSAPRSNPQARVGKVRKDKTGREYILWRPVLKDGSRPRIYLDANKKNMDAELIDVLEASEQLKASKRVIERKEKEARGKGLRGIWKFGTGRKIMSAAPKAKPMLRSSSATPLFDSEGKEYRATYTVIATQDDGLGPVLASNLPDSFRETPQYPSVFQARSLQRLGERQKILKIAKDLDPDRLLLPHSDATLGAPVVWEGDGKTHKAGSSSVKTEKGVFYVLGGNGRTIALLMAPTDRYQAYVQRARSLWPDVWPPGGSPDGTRNILVRVATKPDGSDLSFAQARTLAGRTQKSASGEESPIGRAISLIRSLGIERVSELPPFTWTGIITQDNVADFITENPAFTSAVYDSMGAARAESYKQDPALTANLFNDLMVAYLPRKFQLEGFVSEKQERTLLAALPILLTIKFRVQDGLTQSKWDLFPLLPSALRFSQAIKGKSDRQAIEMVEAAAAQVQLGEGTALSSKFKSLFDELPILGVLLGVVLKKGESTRDPALTVEKYLVPYVEKSMAKEYSPHSGQMGMLAPRGQPDEGSDPSMVLAELLKIALPRKTRQRSLVANPTGSVRPPQSVARAASKALAIRDSLPKSRKAGTRVGLARANQLARRDAVSPETLRRMVSFFARHDGQVERAARLRDPQSKAAQAWGLWGGNAGRRWAQSLVSRKSNPRPRHKVGDSVRFSVYSDAQGWKNTTGTVVAVREHPRPRMSLRTDTPMQYQVRSHSDNRKRWVNDGELASTTVAQRRLLNRKGQLRIGRAASRILERLYLRGATGYAANKDGNFPPGIDELVEKGLATRKTCIPGAQTLYGTDTCTLKLTARGQAFAKNRRRAERTHASARQGRMFNPPQLTLGGIYESQISEDGSRVLDTLRRTGETLFSADADGAFPPGVEEALRKGMAEQLKFESHLTTLFGRDAVTIGLTQRGRRFLKDRRGAAVQEVDKAQGRLFNPYQKKKIRANGSLSQLQLGLLGSIPVLHFASGSNDPGEIRGFADIGKAMGAAYARPSKSKKGSGWSRLCREDCIRELISATEKGIPVFLDSGAFSEVEWTGSGFKTVRPITDKMWKERLDVYQELADRAGLLANVVAPDRVGDQEESFRRLERYAPQIRNLIRRGASVLVPLQKGQLSLSQAHRKAESILGTSDFVPALPFKKAATTPDELRQYLEDIKPKRVHLLGVGPRSAAAPQLADAIRQGSPETQVQMDSVALTAHVGRGKKPRRVTAAQDVARDRLLEERYSSGYSEVVSPDWTDLVGFPSEWATKAALNRIASEAQLSQAQKREMMKDPDGFFQSEIGEVPFYLLAGDSIERELARHLHLVETFEVKRAGAREGLKDLYGSPSFIRNKGGAAPSYFETFGPKGAPQKGQKGYRQAPKIGNAFGGIGPFALASGLLNNALFYLDTPEMKWSWCAELPHLEDCFGDYPEDDTDAVSLADLIGVPMAGGDGERMGETNRAAIALQVVLAAMETDPLRWSGIEVKIGERRSRKSEPQPVFAPREGTGDFGAVPVWAVRLSLTDWFASMIPGYDQALRVVNVSKEEAQRFIEDHHSALPYLNARGLIYALGLMKGDRLVAVATANTPSGRGWLQSARRQTGGLDPANIIELTRVASDGTVKGASSKLVSRLIDVIDDAKRGDPDSPALLVTYQLREEKGTTYKALKDKGLRPVATVKGTKPGGARAGGEFKGDPALGRREKIRWECCAEPPALRADWDLVDPKQVPLLNPLGAVWRRPGSPFAPLPNGSSRPVEIQSFLFERDRFSPKSATTWLGEQGFASQDIRETSKLFRVRVSPPGRFFREQLQIINIDRGICAVVGPPRR